MDAFLLNGKKTMWHAQWLYEPRAGRALSGMILNQQGYCQ